MTNIKSMQGHHDKKNRDTTITHLRWGFGSSFGRFLCHVCRLVATEEVTLSNEVKISTHIGSWRKNHDLPLFWCWWWLWTISLANTRTITFCVCDGKVNFGIRVVRSEINMTSSSSRHIISGTAYLFITFWFTAALRRFVRRFSCFWFTAAFRRFVLCVIRFF